MMAYDQESRYQATADKVLAGLSGQDYEDGMVLVKRIVDEWFDGAGSINQDDLYRIGLSDLKSALEGVSDSEILNQLGMMVLKIEVDNLSAAAFQLASRVVNGDLTAQEARADAEVMSEKINALLKQIHHIQDKEMKQRLLNEMADADLECRYVLEGGNGIMSLRLSHLQ